MNSENVNPVKEKLKKGGRVSAAWLQAGSNITAEIIAESGFDVGMVDLEHGPGDIACLLSQIQAMKGWPTVPFVRAPWNDMVTIKKILDVGTYGLLVPYINTREEAEAAAAAVQYPPQGVRGIAGSPRAAHYGRQPNDYLTRANAEIFLMVAVETLTAVKNLDALLSVERLDGIFIGPSDLSTSMGYFNNPGAEEVKKVIAEVEKKVLASGKALATVAGAWEDAAEKYRRGYSLILFLSDTNSLAQLARSRVEAFKKEFA